MNSWTQQNQNNVMQGFNPYNTNTPYNLQTQMQMYGRLPTYRADPIHGENAAWQFPMGSNSEIYLPDADKDIIWWIRTDAQGSRTVTPFDVMPHVEPEPVNMQEIMARLAAVEEKLNAKQNKSNAKRTNTVPTTATVVDTIESTN